VRTGDNAGERAVEITGERTGTAVAIAKDRDIDQNPDFVGAAKIAALC
jgi:hypothetical protein